MDRIFEGTIDRWIAREHTNGSFGFIEFDHGGSRLDRAYFSESGIEPDNLGRRSHGRIPGNLVRFQLERTIHRGHASCRAINIRSVFDVNVSDPDIHREISKVETVFPRYAFLRRDGGDLIYLNISDVADAFKTLWPTLCEGSKVWHGVAAPSEGHKTWRAVAGEIFAPGEI